MQTGTISVLPSVEFCRKQFITNVSYTFIIIGFYDWKEAPPDMPEVNLNDNQQLSVLNLAYVREIVDPFIGVET